LIWAVSCSLLKEFHRSKQCTQQPHSLLEEGEHRCCPPVESR
jgi:hypothetical protein